MCTAILSLEPGRPVLLAGVRDEFVDRAWLPPGRHWPDHPGLIGGRDLLAGGTWLVVAPESHRVTCVLNGPGPAAPPGSRQTRGMLPLQVADGGRLGSQALERFDPFHLLTAEPGAAVLWSWNGQRLTERELKPGLHMVVNGGLAGDLRNARDHERARIAHFLPRLRDAARPDPLGGGQAPEAWGAWLPLVSGDGIASDDPRALIVRRDLGAGRVFGTTSVPGDMGGWRSVSVN